MRSIRLLNNCRDFRPLTIHLYDLVGSDESRPFSPHCWKTAMSLAHKGLNFERIPTAFTAVPKIEDGVSKTVPVIRDGGRVVRDSFDIAVYLDETYPDRPVLLGGAGGIALSRFIESWTMATIHPFVGSAALMDIYECLSPDDQSYFRSSREQRMGRRLEDVVANRDEKIEGFLKTLAPLRMTLDRQLFLGGPTPLFADYIVFGAFQWLRVTCPMPVMPVDDPVTAWFERCLDLHGGIAREVPAASGTISN